MQKQPPTSPPTRPAADGTEEAPASSSQAQASDSVAEVQVLLERLRVAELARGVAEHARGVAESQALEEKNARVLQESVSSGKYFATIRDIWPTPRLFQMNKQNWRSQFETVCRENVPRFSRSCLSGDHRPRQEFIVSRKGAVDNSFIVGESVTTVNNDLIPVDIFGQPIDATDKAHLLPKARNDAITWTDVGCAVLAIPLETVESERIAKVPRQQQTAAKAVLGCQSGTEKRPGIRNLLSNIARFSNQGPLFDQNADTLIFPIRTLHQARKWNGEGYDAIVICKEPIQAVRVGMTSIQANDKSVEATTDEVNCAVGLAKHLCRFLALGALERGEKEVSNYQKSATEEQKLTEFFRSEMIPLPEELSCTPPDKRIRKVRFYGHSDGPPDLLHHPAPDPLLLGFKSSNNFMRHFAGFRMVAGAEPNELDDLSEEGHRNLKAYIEWEKEQEQEAVHREILHPRGKGEDLRVVCVSVSYSDSECSSLGDADNNDNNNETPQPMLSGFEYGQL